MKKIIIILIVFLWCLTIASYFLPSTYPSPCNKATYLHPISGSHFPDGRICSAVLNLRAPMRAHYFIIDLTVLNSAIALLLLYLRRYKSRTIKALKILLFTFVIISTLISLFLFIISLLLAFSY